MLDLVEEPFDWVSRAVKIRAEADRVFAVPFRRNVRSCSLLAGKLPNPVGVIATIREQHRLRKQRAEENRALPVIMWIRELAHQQGAWANIPPKRNRKDPICFSPYLYRARNLIERFFNKIKQCRRVATGYDKLAANYLAFVKLASIRIWLRANESTS